MVDKVTVAAKLAALDRYVERVRLHARRSAAELAADPDALDLVSFNLMLAVQSCADIASHVIADQGWAPAATLAESFQRLHQHRVLSRETATAMSRAAGLRNVVAHVYANVDPDLVHRASTSGLEDLSRFAQELLAWMQNG